MSKMHAKQNNRSASVSSTKNKVQSRSTPKSLSKLCEANFCQIKLWIFIILALVMAINVVLSGYIMHQKNYNDAQESADTCFLGDGGCYTVQTSSYAVTFGIPNPYYGYVFFTIGVLIFILFAIQSVKPVISKSLYADLSDYTLFGMILGTLFSLWLLYVQIFILKTTCKYCLAVDLIMIISTIIFFWIWLKLKKRSAQELLKEKLLD
jgi:uncharacterized membrane protein